MLIDTEILKEDFYLSFRFINIPSLLSSINLYENKDVTYLKIIDDDLDIKNDFINTFITFKKAYAKVLVNKITKQNLNYYNNTLDTF